jgi:hypothetical protein
MKLKWNNYLILLEQPYEKELILYCYFQANINEFIYQGYSDTATFFIILPFKKFNLLFEIF